jgi:hypothetical protein
LGIAELPSLAEDDPEAWNVQVLNVNYFFVSNLGFLIYHI